tara:strand:- start:2716 stop:3402 length:687 start_codon:yes stop_codon:yes gene_type:complete
MKISEDTLSILNNFSSIQGSIVVEPGSVISTIAAGKNILAKATVDETFPKNFGIYELGQFLSAVSLLEEPSFDFSDDFVDVNSGKQNIRYGYTDPTLIPSPPATGVTLPQVDLSFVLTNDNLKAIKKAAGVLGLPHVSIESSAESLVACVSDKSKGKSSNSFDVSLDTESGKNGVTDFCSTFIVDNLKMFPGDYDVKIAGQGIAQFSHKELDLEYWISSESQYSTISD